MEAEDFLAMSRPSEMYLKEEEGEEAGEGEGGTLEGGAESAGAGCGMKWGRSSVAIVIVINCCWCLVTECLTTSSVLKEVEVGLLVR